MTPFKSSVKRFAKPVVESVLTSRAMPGCWLRSLRLYRILSVEYGHLRSAATMRSIDANGEAIPWITYPALEYLKQLDFSDRAVFEYGCGGSTIFWSRLAKRVDSVEHDLDFYQFVRPRLPENCTLSLEVVPEEYVRAPERNGPYDVIVIDGHSRVRCSELAPRYLKEGGLIILDNSDWFVEASANLRNADLIEVDMAGMAPISDFVSTTSFYFHRQFRGTPRAGTQPAGAIGSVAKPYFPKVTGPQSAASTGHAPATSLRTTIGRETVDTQRDPEFSLLEYPLPAGSSMSGDNGSEHQVTTGVAPELLR